MMKCPQCGSAMRTRRENFRYDASGLPGVTLLGVEVRRCPKCGEYEVSIPNIEGLHRTIAFAVIRKRTRLTPAEIRYLRTSLGWSGADFARHMGVAAETVSRWETGATPMGAAADRLLRLMVVTRAPVSDYSLDELAAIDEAKAPTTTRLGLRSGEAGWHAEAA